MALIVIYIKQSCVALLSEVAVVLSSVFLTPLVIFSESGSGMVHVRMVQDRQTSSPPVQIFRGGTKESYTYLERVFRSQAAVAVECQVFSCASA